MARIPDTLRRQRQDLYYAHWVALMQKISDLNNKGHNLRFAPELLKPNCWSQVRVKAIRRALIQYYLIDIYLFEPVLISNLVVFYLKEFLSGKRALGTTANWDIFKQAHSDFPPPPFPLDEQEE